MTDEDTDIESANMVEDATMIISAASMVSYKASRYQRTGYDHLRQEAIDKLEVIRDIAGESLEQYGEEP